MLDVEKVFNQIIFARDMLRYGIISLADLDFGFLTNGY